MRAEASFAVPVKLWALLCVFAGVTIGGNVLLTCILTGGALLYLVLQRNFRLAASYGCFYLLLALLLYGIRFHGLRMPVFSEFYVLMFWNLSPIFLVSWDLITTPPGMLSAFLSRLRVPTPGTRQLAQTLRQLRAQGFTLLIAEHRIDWLMGIADRFLYLRDGRIAAEYTPEDLLLLPEADILGMGLRSPRKEMSLPAPSVSDESPAVLKTAGLLKRIRKEVIFEDISLSVREGSVTAITGQNGAGKTTLAHVLCGLAKQTRGHILIDGKKARAAVRRREIYYCGNDTSTQFFTASVAEELLLNTRLTEEIKSNARELLKELGLYEYRDAHPSTLSGGQKQRLSHSPPGAGLSVLPPAGGVHHGGNGAGTGRWRRMRKASAPRKLSPDVSRRLSDSRRQSAALTLREIHCPFCSFLVEKVFSDAAGHKMVYCRKCKSEYPINLGCFRRIKAKQAVCRLLSGKPRQKR